MKRLLVTLLLIVSIKDIASAQFKKPVTVKISTPQVQCEECKKRIEGYMKHEEGIAKIIVDFRRQTTTVTFLPDRTNIENIKTTIANLGFDADDVTANEEAYNKLPPCCKKKKEKVE